MRYILSQVVSWLNGKNVDGMVEGFCLLNSHQTSTANTFFTHDCEFYKETMCGKVREGIGDKKGVLLFYAAPSLKTRINFPLNCISFTNPRTHGDGMHLSGKTKRIGLSSGSFTSCL